MIRGTESVDMAVSVRVTMPTEGETPETAFVSALSGPESFGNGKKWGAKVVQKLKELTRMRMVHFSNLRLALNPSQPILAITRGRSR
jgi:hypothetical protein